MGKPVLMDFFAIWCGPCGVQSPVIEEVAKRMGDQAEVRQVNVDNEMDVATKYRIYVVPTLIIEKDAKVIRRIEGISQGPLGRVLDTRVNEEDMKAISFMGFRSVEEFLGYQRRAIEEEKEWIRAHPKYKAVEYFDGVDSVPDLTGFRGEKSKWFMGFRSHDEYVAYEAQKLEGMLRSLVEPS